MLGEDKKTTDQLMQPETDSFDRKTKKTSNIVIGASTLFSLAILAVVVASKQDTKTDLNESRASGFLAVDLNTQCVAKSQPEWAFEETCLSSLDRFYSQ